MKIYGHVEEALPPELVPPSRFSDVTLVATPVELRRIAGFMQNCADEMERRGDACHHLHLHDRDPVFAQAPQLTVEQAR